MKNFKVYECGSILYFAKAESNLGGDITNPSLRWTMYPIAVWDYVDPDYSDKQFWVQQSVPNTGLYPNETFEELQYILDETAQDVFAESGYKLKAVSEIYFNDFESDSRAKKISVEDAVYNALDLI